MTKEELDYRLKQLEAEDVECTRFSHSALFGLKSMGDLTDVLIADACKLKLYYIAKDLINFREQVFGISNVLHNKILDEQIRIAQGINLINKARDSEDKS